jgi:hypothetical protein
LAWVHVNVVAGCFGGHSKAQPGQQVAGRAEDQEPPGVEEKQT